MSNVWENIFKKKKWGEYPPEDLIRFIKRYKRNKKNLNQIKLLEVGCGPGANINFLKKEGFDVYGIDMSPTAISKINLSLSRNNKKNFQIGSFSSLPWPDNFFHGVIDNFSIYANEFNTISKTYNEIYRVVKKKGFFFSKVWGTRTQGCGTGKKIENSTFTNIKIGPCKDMGVSHFFTYKELKKMNKNYKINQIDKNYYTDKYLNKNFFVEIFISKSFK